MDYNHIKDFLDKFKNILFSKEEKIKNIALVVKKNTGVETESKHIVISGNKIQIKASPLAKNEILINKEKILKDLFEIDGFQYKDIR